MRIVDQGKKLENGVVLHGAYGLAVTQFSAVCV